MDLKGDLVSNWQYFRSSWKNYEIATELNKKDIPIRVATLLSVMGKECYQVYENLPMSEEERKDPEVILVSLGTHFEPQRNTIYERYVFNSAFQESNENIEQFLNRLRKLASTCVYATLLDELIRDRLVIGIRDNASRARLLRESSLTLSKAIDICRSSELATLQIQLMDKTEDAVHQFSSKSRNAQRHQSTDTCKYCGRKHQYGKCPAFGHECEKCHKRNHFAEVCQSRAPSMSSKGAKPKQQAASKQYKHKPKQKVHQVDADSDEDEFSSTGSVYNIRAAGTQYFVKLKTRTLTGSKPVTLKFQIDSGATCSTLRLQDYNRVTTEPLKPSTTRLRLYDKSTIQPVGAATLQCMASNDIKKRIHFEVLKDAPTSLLSGKASEALKLLQFSKEHLIYEVRTEPALTVATILRDYKDVFSGLGRLPGTYHIETDDTVKPVQNTKRRVPIPVRDELKAKLKSLEDQKIITKVEEPTPWISNMVVVKKPNKLRICLDPQNLNKAIKRNHYPIPTIEEVAPRLANAKVFSVVDAKDGFLQVVLDQESSYLTTFWTPHGRYRWLRMPFGISSAPEEFQRRLDEVLEGLENIEVIADDIVVYGTGDTLEEAEASHDRAFKALLQRCRDRGAKLNAKKIKFKMPSVAYMGHVLTDKGLAPDPEKVRAIQEMPRPTDVQGVQRLLGLATYLSKFLPKLSTVAEPLRRLTDKDVKFQWLPEHDKVLDTLKQLITEAPVLEYYDVDKEVTIECDSSDVGLGAVLTQDGKLVHCVSRALTPAERNYAQIEKECLAIVFANERFNQYILGRESIRVQTDHKPLVSIFSKPVLSSPKRLQRMRLRLQKYSLAVEYKPGPEMIISDTLSRAYLPEQDVKPDASPYVIFQLEEERSFQEELADINMETDVYVTNERLQQIRIETHRDNTLQTLSNMILAGWPDNKMDVPLCIREYWPFRDELATQNGIIYRGTRIVIPTKLRPDLVTRAHASHQGIQSTINTAREIMYWPHMNMDLTHAVQKCSTCQEFQPAVPKEPMMTHPLPSYPWQVVATDCFELDGEHYCVYVDTYSDYIDIIELEDLTGKTLVKKSRPVFATHGKPEVVISDNGPNYASREFADFSRQWEFRHVTTSPHYSKANGKAESAVKIAKGIIKKAKRSGGDIWQAILEWRNTPTPGMKTSPAQRLMSRRTRSFLPCKETLYKPEVQDDVPAQVAQKRKQAKKFYDRGAKPLPELVFGQPIRVKIRPKVDNCPWKPGIVKEKVAPRSYIVEVDGRRYRRNRVHLKDTLELPQQNTVPMTEIMDTAPKNTVPESTSKPMNTENSASGHTPEPAETSASSMCPKTPQTVTTRAGRVSRRPQHLKDFM